MNAEQIMNLIVSILAGLAAAIPLVAKLVIVVQETVRAKNWYKVVDYAVKVMQTAEVMYSDGVTKKDFVMSQLMLNADYIDYDMDDRDWAHISDMIDRIVAAAKVVNTPEEPYEIETEYRGPEENYGEEAEEEEVNE